MPAESAASSTILASQLILLLIVVSAVAVVMRRLRLPYTVGLVLAGLALAFFNIELPFKLDYDLLLHVFLPALLFEAAINLDVIRLRRNLVPVLLFALPGTVACTGIVGAVSHYLFNLPWSLAFLFGALIAPTDPLSVLGLFRQLGLNRELSTIVEGESLFNDAIAIVVFMLFLGQVQAEVALGVTSGIPLVSGLKQFALVAFGGFALGAVSGFLVSRVTREIDDHLVETTLSMILAYGSFLLAEHFGTSGAMAVIVAGLTLGSYGRRTGMSPATRVAVHTSWEYVGFLANSVVFLLIGHELRGHVIISNTLIILLAFTVVLFARALAVYGLSLVIRLHGHVLPTSWQHVLVWASLKGGISMVLALVAHTYEPGNFVVNATFGVVLVSLLAQGLTMKKLLRVLCPGEAPEAVQDIERSFGRMRAAQAALLELQRWRDSALAPPGVIDQLQTAYRRRAEQQEQVLVELHAQHEHLHREQLREAQRAALLAEKTALLEAYRAGRLSQEVATELMEDVDERIDAVEQPREAAEPDTAS